MINPEMFLVEELFSARIEKRSPRDGYGQGLLELGERDESVVVLCADLSDSTRAAYFRDKYPKRFFEIGVAEQNMAGIGAGLASEGKIPFISSFGVFSPGRNWDQIRVSVCYSEANVKIIGAHTGLNVGEDGATHQALEDIAITRCLPNMTVLVPGDALEVKKAVLAAAGIRGPVYIRFGREKVPVFTSEKTPFVIGQAQKLRKGNDVAIIACGFLVYEALLAAEELAGLGIQATVINNPGIKPLDTETLVEAARETGAVVTAEEHQGSGGLGSAVAECLVRHCPAPMEMVAVNDTFGESGKAAELIDKYRLNSAAIQAAAKRVISRK